MTIQQAAVNLQRKRRAQRALGSSVPNRRTRPAPRRGLNTRDDISVIGADEAFQLINWVPDVSGVSLRPGRVFQEAAGAEAARRLYNYSSGAVDAYIMATPTKLIAAIESGNVEKTGCTSYDWTAAMMNDVLIMANGSDALTSFNGAAWVDLAVSGGPDPTALWGVKIYKSRSYFWQKEKLGFYYSAVEAAAGELTYFNLQQTAQLGGYVMSMNSWSQDGGDGPDDYLIIATTKGEVLAYAGSNPNDPNDWALIGVFRIDEPVSKHAFLELDDKIHVLTKSDYEVLPDRFLKFKQDHTKISGAVQSAYGAYSAFDQWQLIADTSRKWVIANIPTGANTSEQYVLAQGGWTIFQDWDALGFTMSAGALYHGTKDGVYRVDGVFDENASAEEVAIKWSAKMSYANLGTNREKRISAFRFLMRASLDQQITAALSYDISGEFADSQAVTLAGSGSTAWGDPWGSAFSQSGILNSLWLVGIGTGQLVSATVSGSSKQALTWVHTDFEFVVGGMY